MRILLLLTNKNVILGMDIGPPPENKFSENYQSGPLSFEIIFKGKKLVQKQLLGLAK